MLINRIVFLLNIQLIYLLLDLNFRFQHVILDIRASFTSLSKFPLDGN